MNKMTYDDFDEQIDQTELLPEEIDDEPVYEVTARATSPWSIL